MISKLIGSAGFLSSGGTIGGDLTISGDLTVSGTSGGYAFTEVLSGDMIIDQDVNSPALKIDTEADTAHGVWLNNPQQTSGNIININEAVALTTGSIISAVSSSSSTGTRNLVEVSNTNASATGATVMKLSNNSSGHLLDLKSDYDSGASNGAKMRLYNDDGATMADGHRLGVIEFAGAEDSSNNLAIGATIEAFATEAWDATNNAAKMVISTTADDNSPVSIIEASTSVFKWMANGSNVNLSATTSGVQSGGYVYAGSNAKMLNETSSATNPVFLTAADFTDGIGGASGTVALITNSLSRLIVDDNSRISLSNNDGGTENTVFGNLAWDAGSGAGADYNSLFGYGAGRYLADDGVSNHSSYNTAFGNKAIGGGHTSTATGNTANKNVGIGYHAVGGGTGGTTNLTAASNVGVGYDALQAISTGGNNIAIGSSAADSLTTGAATIAIGTASLQALDVQDYNIAIGHNAGTSISHSNSDNNIIIGGLAGTGGTGEMTNNIVMGLAAFASTDDTAQYGNIAIGYYALNAQDTATAVAIGDTANPNIAIGYEAGKGITSGDSNVIIGHLSHGKGSAAGRGDDNVYIGARSAYTATDADSNVAIGRDSLYSTTAGAYNVAIGHSALYTANHASNNGTVAIGYDALKAKNLASGSSLDGATVAIGYQSLTSLTSGTGNIAIGHKAAYALTTGANNVYLGYEAGYGSSAVANNNVAIGWKTMSNRTSGDDNVVIGYNAGAAMTTSSGTVAIGKEALTSLVGANNNTALGYQALQHCVDGEANIAIGNGALGDWDVGGGTNTTVDGSSFNVMIGRNAGGGAWTNVQSNYNVGIGNYVMDDAMAGAVENTAVGHNALSGITTGYENVAVGYQAGWKVTTGYGNVCLGKDAGDSLTTENGSILIGSNAGQKIGTDSGAGGDGQVCIGYAAGQDIDTGEGNTAIGYNALTLEDDGDFNTAVGWKALSVQEGTSGEVGNTVVGYQSGQFVTTATGSTFIGAKAGQGITGTRLTGNNNTAVGKDAGLLLQGDAESNTLVGATSGDAITTGDFNTSVGAGSASAINTGQGNTAVGINAGDTITNGTYNVCVGREADVSASGSSNQIVIGNNVTGTADNAVHIGNNTSHIRCDFNTDQTWDASSDRRQKKDIKESELGLDFINDLKPCKYKYKSPSEFPEEWKAYDSDDKEPMGGSDKYYYGFIAQEVKESIDKYDASDYGAWNVDDDGRQRVSREQFVVSLVKSVQELSAKVEELEAKLSK